MRLLSTKSLRIDGAPFATDEERAPIPSERIRQTLNLAAGGQWGDPSSRWETLQALSTKRWKKVKAYLQAYYDDRGNNHLRVPTSYVAPDGFKLGETVSVMRSTQKIYLAGHPDRIAWVRERGWVWHTRDAAKNAARWAEVGF